MSNTIMKKSGDLLKHNHVFTGWAGGRPYFYYKAGGGVIDNIGRQHITLYGRCDICQEEIPIGNIHVRENGTLYGLKTENNGKTI